MFGLSLQELMIVGVVAVLLFGKRLPEVAKSLGQGYAQFRRGLQDIQSEMNSVVSTDDNYSSSSSSSTASLTHNEHEYDEPTAPKFEPPVADAGDNAETASTTES